MVAIQLPLPLRVSEPDAKTLNGIVLALISDGQWYMPWELCSAILARHRVRISDSSVTARLRELRKTRFGAHDIIKRLRAGSRAYEYRLNEGEK